MSPLGLRWVFFALRKTVIRTVVDQMLSGAAGYLTKRALAYVCEKRNLALADDLHERLIEADLLLPPYPEVPAALARLAARFDLYMLSWSRQAPGAATQEEERHHGQ